MKVVVWPPASHPRLADIVATLPDVQLETVSSLDQLDAARDGIVALVIGGVDYDARTADVLQRIPSLRLLHTLSAGYDRLLQFGVADDVTICTAGDAWSPVVAEHAMALLLALVRQLPAALSQQSEAKWDRSLGSKLRSLDGMTLAIVGLGSIGREIAARARAFGMTVIGVSRSGAPHPSAAEVYPSSSLHTALARADAVVIATALTTETRHLMNDAAFAALRPGAFVVNISRGGTLDQAALLRAIDAGIVAGAGLDVADPEPLPPNDPVWRRPEIILTPHLAGLGSVSARQRLAELVRDNIDAFRKGDALRNCLRDRRT
jgi:phosphoglycerate dehydrogenase-like enzyme